MAIDDVDTPGSDGWWMQKAWLELKAKRCEYTKLENYRRGTPPVSMGSAKVASAFYKFQRQCRTNLADLAVQALIERLAVRTIRTAAGSDDDGDVVATRLWQASGMDVAHPDLLRMIATFGEGYTWTSAPSAPGEFSQISPEDPRECVVLFDAMGRAVAGFKLFHDALGGYDYAILFRPGRKVVAYSEKGTPPPRLAPDGSLREPKIRFDPRRFTIRPERPADVPEDDDPTTPLWSESYEIQDIPLERHLAPDGVGVFQRHLDLIDQVNHIILQGLVIATLQAFRQRAIELAEELPEEDEDGNKIDYDDLFAADPGAMWELPVGAKIWESGQVDMSGILNQAKDAIQRFAAVLRLPFSLFVSDAANQSAEGAQLTREGLVFKAEDYQRVETRALLRSISTAFKFMPDDVRYAEVNGQRVDRADLAGMSIDWLPAERYSLAEKAQADAQAPSLPRRQKLRLIWQMTPAEVDVAMGQAQEDALMAASAAAATSGANGGGAAGG